MTKNILNYGHLNGPLHNKIRKQKVINNLNI